MQLKMTASFKTKKLPLFFFTALLSPCAPKWSIFSSMFFMADYGKSHLRVNDFLAPLGNEEGICLVLNNTKLHLNGKEVLSR